MNEQMDIFSFIKGKNEQSVSLSKGQTVYFVNMADVIKAKVSNDGTWCCKGHDGKYRIEKTSGLFGGWNNSRDEEIFLDYSKAKEQADEYMKTHEVIPASSIKPESIAAYSYIRGCDGREMVAFYCDIGNGMYYIKEFMTFHHIVKNSKAVRKFMEQQEFKQEKVEQIEDFVPHFKNMYKCTKHSNWDYAECEYTYAVG